MIELVIHLRNFMQNTRFNMTKKQITEYLILFVLGLIITIGFVNPVSKEYTWWNLIYKSKDLIQ